MQHWRYCQSSLGFCCGFSIFKFRILILWRQPMRRLVNHLSSLNLLRQAMQDFFFHSEVRMGVQRLRQWVCSRSKHWVLYLWSFILLIDDIYFVSRMKWLNRPNILILQEQPDDGKEKGKLLDLKKITWLNTWKGVWISFILENHNPSVRTWTKAMCLSITQNTDQLSPPLRRKISVTVYVACTPQ